MDQMTAKTVHVTTEGQMPKSIKSTEFPGKTYSDLSKLGWPKIRELFEAAGERFTVSIERLDCTVSPRRQLSSMELDEVLDIFDSPTSSNNILCTAVVRYGYGNDQLELCLSIDVDTQSPSLTVFVYILCFNIEEGLALLEEHGAKIIRDTSV